MIKSRLLTSRYPIELAVNLADVITILNKNEAEIISVTQSESMAGNIWNGTIIIIYKESTT
jgi:hypothetical protein